MSFYELAQQRFSIRNFQDKPISQEHMDQILAAGRFAPTACNFQPQKVYVAQSKEALEKLASVCKCTFHAPCIMVVCYDNNLDWKNKLQPGYQSGTVDASIVCTHMMLQAFELGIGSCWVGYFNADKVAQALELPENISVVALLPMGYPAQDAKPLDLHSQYRDLSEMVEYI